MTAHQKPPRTDPGRPVLAERAYQALKERILDQRLAPGSRLCIDALATELGMSPTPVREALAGLAAERLISFTAFKGYAVAPMLTPRQLADLFQVRRLLEVEAARLAAGRVLAAQVTAMERELAAQAAHAPDPAFAGFRAFNRRDQRFHDLLVAAADNDALLATYRGLAVHNHLSRLHHGRQDIDYAAVVEEHAAIYRALLSRDALAAQRAMLAHLDQAERLLSDFLTEPPAGGPGGSPDRARNPHLG